MLEFFKPGDLPGADPELIYPPRDTTTYAEIQQASQLVSFGCAESQHMAGWAPIGESASAFFLPRSKVLLWKFGQQED